MGNREDEAELMSAVYRELRRLAAYYLRQERAGHTLQPTALVHEAYLHLAAQKGADWQNRAHFFSAAAQAMRRILVDYARERRAQKRGGDRQRVPPDEAFTFAEERSEDLLALDGALEKLAGLDPRQSRIVELRFFGGLTEAEIAEVLGVSEKTVKRDWSVAKAWLYAEMSQ